MGQSEGVRVSEHEGECEGDRVTSDPERVSECISSESIPLFMVFVSFGVFAQLFAATFSVSASTFTHIQPLTLRPFALSLRSVLCAVSVHLLECLFVRLPLSPLLESVRVAIPPHCSLCNLVFNWFARSDHERVRLFFGAESVPRFAPILSLPF